MCQIQTRKNIKTKKIKNYEKNLSGTMLECEQTQIRVTSISHWMILSGEMWLYVYKKKKKRQNYGVFISHTQENDITKSQRACIWRKEIQNRNLFRRKWLCSITARVYALISWNVREAHTLRTGDILSVAYRIFIMKIIFNSEKNILLCLDFISN